MADYNSPIEYVQSRASLIDKINAIDSIIDALIISAAAGAGTGHFMQYSLDDGQTKISTSYRSVGDVEAGIRGFERLKHYYLNQLNGRRVRLMDISNFRP